MSQPSSSLRGAAVAERADRTRRPRRVGRSSRAAVIPAAGRPVRSALVRVPFVVMLIAVLAVGVGGVLYLNTKTDESGMRTEQAKATAATLRLKVEELSRTVADLGATPRLAAEAQALGLVPAGDAAIMTVGSDGATTLIGTPTKAKASAGTGAGR